MTLEQRVSEYIKFGSINGVEPRITAAFEAECNRQLNKGGELPLIEMLDFLFDTK